MLRHAHNTLELRTSPNDKFTIIWPTELAPDACALQPAVEIGSDPEGQFLAWAHAAKGLRLSTEVLRQFGDLSATELDVSIVDQYACPYTEPISVSSSSYSGGTPGLTFNKGQQMRLEVSSRDGRLILILIEAPSAAEFDTLKPLAEKILSTLKFTPS